MQTEKNKKIGVGIMALGLLGSILFFWYFKLDGHVIDYNNGPVFVGFILGSLSLISGLYFGLSLYGNKKLANQIGGVLFLFLILGCLVSFLRQ